jgi:hypothetical protein
MAKGSSKNLRQIGGYGEKGEVSQEGWLFKGLGIAY